VNKLLDDVIVKTKNATNENVTLTRIVFACAAEFHNTNPTQW